jgi:cytochrome c biogenesis protein CcmG/thiol:disulfide interchange protein DsbE
VRDHIVPQFRQSVLCAWPTAAILLLASATGCDRGSRPNQIGQTAPQFSITDDARTIDLAHLRGRVVVLNFWASWCAPCLQELPSLIALQHQLPQVQVLGVSTDADPAAYQAFLNRHHVDFLTIRDGAQTSNALYGTFRYPETYIIDKHGELRRKFIGPQDWTSPEIVDFLQKLSSAS